MKTEMDVPTAILSRHYQWPALCAISEVLKTNGYQALLAGGCVRDAILGIRPQDLDVATNATPEQVEALFPRTVAVGKSFGVIRVLHEGAEVEVATFRQDGFYEDGRHPNTVQFSTPEEDAKRRDFTMNALFLDIETGKLIDYVEGVKDLRAGLIRTVGSPEKRFAEDHLRLLRAVRFSGQLGFAIEAETFSAIEKYAPQIQQVSAERREEEMTKLLKSSFVSLALKNLKRSGLMSVLFPFRGEDESFLALPADQDWKRWSLFFLPLLKLEPKQSLTKLKEIFHAGRFSNRDRRRIEEVFALLSRPENHFRQDAGERLLAYFEESTRWAYQILSYQGHVMAPASADFAASPVSAASPDLAASPWQNLIQTDHAAWLAMGGQKPEGFLRGSDIIAAKVVGPRVGELLKKSYLLQLRGVLTHRESALEWLKGVL